MPPRKLIGNLVVVHVRPISFQVVAHDGPQLAWTKPLFVDGNSLPGQDKKRGVFLNTTDVAEPGEILAVLGGVLEREEYAELLFNSGHGEKLEYVGPPAGGFYVNGALFEDGSPMPASEKVRPSLVDCISTGRVGNLIRDERLTAGRRANCEVRALAVRGFHMLSGGSGNLKEVPFALCFVATRRVRGGEELLRACDDARYAMGPPTMPYPSRDVLWEAPPGDVAGGIEELDVAGSFRVLRGRQAAREKMAQGLECVPWPADVLGLGPAVAVREEEFEVRGADEEMPAQGGVHVEHFFA